MSQGCKPKKAFGRLLLQECAESKVLRYWKVSEGFCKECVQGPSLRLEVVRRSGGINLLNLFKVA
jgi:hypothetical protein